MENGTVTGGQGGEVVGLLLQALEGLGYGEAATVLEREAGKGTDVAAADAVAERQRLRAAQGRLEEAVLGGDWHTVVEHHLPGLFFSPPQAQGQAHACFLVRRQQYLEALLSSMLSQTPSTDEEVGEQEEKEDTVPSTSPSPLALLRGPVATACAQLPPEVGPQILHSLSLLLLLLPPPPPLVVSDGKKHNSNGVVVIAGMTPQERAALLCRAAGWAGGGEAGRRALLKDIHVLLCPRATACLSPFPFSPTDTTTRLASLLHKAGESLQEGEGAGSLPSSSVLGGGGGPVMVPQLCQALLEGHTGEVWCLAFHPTQGHLLASGARDGSLVVWDLSGLLRRMRAGGLGGGEEEEEELIRVQARISGLPHPPHLLQWHPTSSTHPSLLVACTPQSPSSSPHAHDIIRISADKGEHLWAYKGHTAQVTALAWLPDGRRFLSGGQDKRLLLWQTDPFPSLLCEWRVGNRLASPRITGLAVASPSPSPSSIGEEEEGGGIKVLALLGEHSLVALRLLLSTSSSTDDDQDARRQAQEQEEKEKQRPCLLVERGAALRLPPPPPSSSSSPPELPSTGEGAGAEMEIEWPAVQFRPQGGKGPMLLPSGVGPWVPPPARIGGAADRRPSSSSASSSPPPGGGVELRLHVSSDSSESDSEEEEEEELDDEEEEEEEEEYSEGETEAAEMAAAAETALGAAAAAAAAAVAGVTNGSSRARAQEQEEEEEGQGGLLPVCPWRLVETEEVCFRRVVTGFSLSPSGGHALVDLAGGLVLQWDLQSARPSARFLGRKQHRYVLSSAIGGPGGEEGGEGMLVASGSEDGKVLLWHAGGGEEAPVVALQGHGGIVSSVAWCPSSHAPLLASASDDHTVRLWVAPESAVVGDEVVVVRALEGEEEDGM